MKTSSKGYLLYWAIKLSICALIVVPKISVLLLILISVVALMSSKSKFPVNKTFTVEALLILMFVVWIITTVMFSSSNPSDLESWAGVAKIVGLFGVGFLVWFFLPGFMWLNENLARSAFFWGGVGGVTIIIGAAIYAIIAKDSLWGSYFNDPLTTLNNSSVLVSLLIWPALLSLKRKSFGSMVVTGVITLSVVAFLSSTAALCAIFVGGGVFLVRGFIGIKGGVIMAVTAAMLVICAPYIIKISGTDAFATPTAVNDQASSIPASTRHRLAMWSFAVEKIDEKPWLGWGVGASRHIPQEDRRLAPNMEIMPLHPHNLALQTRLELGVPGSLILAGLVFTILYRLATFTNDRWLSGLAMAPAAGWLFVANVSYGMWQSWWIALAFLLAVLMKFALASYAPSKE